MPEIEYTNDHDLLIELRTEMRGLRADVNKFNNDIIGRIGELEKYKLDIETWREKNKNIFDINNDHETRIRNNEKNITMIMTWGAAFVLVLGIAQFLIGKFL